MTEQQAAAEFARFCRALGKNPKDLTEEQGASWLRALMDLSYERGRAALSATINQWQNTAFPTVGFFNARAKEIDYEGSPNAVAYSQDGPARGTPVSEYEIWRQDQIAAMTEEDYWKYMTDVEMRRHWERRWERDWAGRSTRQSTGRFNLHRTDVRPGKNGGMSHEHSHNRSAASR